MMREHALFWDGAGKVHYVPLAQHDLLNIRATILWLLAKSEHSQWSFLCAFRMSPEGRPETILDRAMYNARPPTPQEAEQAVQFLADDLGAPPR